MTTTSKVTLPLTVAQAAALWKMSTTRVKQLVEQGRVKHSKVGTGPSGGARLILIYQEQAPERVAPGTLKGTSK